MLLGRLTDTLHSSDFGTGFGSEFGAATADVIPIGRRAGIPLSQSDKSQRAPRDEQQQLAEHALIEAGRALAAATAGLEEAQSARDRRGPGRFCRTRAGSGPAAAVRGSDQGGVRCRPQSA